MIDRLMRMLASLPGAEVTIDDRDLEDRIRAVEIHIDSLLFRAEHLNSDNREQDSSVSE